MPHPRTRLRVVTPDDLPFDSALIVPILPPGREVEILTDQSQDWLGDFFAAIESHRCPGCACAIEHIVQVGAMIDALPCGHRLGIARVRDAADHFGLAIGGG